MDETRVDALYREWQRSVREHACMVRDARMSGLTADELNALSEAYVLRIDTAYVRFLRAEQRRGSWAAAAY
ncbi:MAG: hypothetical protein JO097_10660 [Acidobacteriaceae bacterium]|nr:hypothetical protein [Acidobacteriaceae bacterium]MBV9296736.1 hypothetical protein [Acidobacteriaceae bacterium]MBV9767282.1 hypothetical protein [Acidobacteriaceae bacterium]